MSSPIGLNAGMSVQAVAPFKATSLAQPLSDRAATPAETAQARADAAAEAQKATLAAIREKGLYAWAQEEKMKALKEKIRAEVMAERKIDDDSLAKLDPEARASAEKSIEEEVARRIKDAMQAALEAEAQKAAKEGRPPKPMIIDISV